MSGNLKLRIKKPKTDGITSITDTRSSSPSPSPSSRSPSPPAPSPSPPPVNTARRPKTILDYLCSLPSSTLTNLYGDAHTVLTIFRSLPPLAKQYVLRMIFLGHQHQNDKQNSIADIGIPQSVLDNWCRGEIINQQAHHQSINRLTELRVFNKTSRPTDTREVIYLLNHAFCRQLQRALCNQSERNFYSSYSRGRCYRSPKV